MNRMIVSALGMFLWSLAGPAVAIGPIRTVEELVAAVKDADEGDTIELAAGRFELDATLELKGRLTLKGAGVDKTTLTHAAAWKPSAQSLPDPEMKLEGLDVDAYLVRVQRDGGGRWEKGRPGVKGGITGGGIFAVWMSDCEIFDNRFVSTRGVIWINEAFNNLEVRNNHIVARTTTTPRKDGLFGFNPKCDFKTIVI